MNRIDEINVLIDEVIVGQTIENPNLRIHRFMSSIQVHDTTFAGMRGKKVREFTAYDLDEVDDFQAVERAAKELENAETFDQAVKILKAIPGVKYGEGEKKGVDVPAGKIEIKTPKIEIWATTLEYSIMDLEDKTNEPACISREKKRDNAKVYAWIKKNQKKIEKMSFRDVVMALMDMKVEFHQYCRMD